MLGAAAVADYRPAEAITGKMRRTADEIEPKRVRNPDVLSALAKASKKGAKVIGFAAETQNVIANARTKLARKGCDWILANDVSPQTGVMGGDRNTISLVTKDGVENWPPQSKDDVARTLIERIGKTIAT